VFIVFIFSLIIFEAFVVLQGAEVYSRGIWSRSDALKRGKVWRNPLYFTWHGGMYGDALVVSWIAAWSFAYYGKDWSLWQIIRAFALSLVVSHLMHEMWRRESLKADGPHYENGRTLAAGWAHYLYMIATLSTFILLFFWTPNVSRSFITLATIGLAAHIAVGLIQPHYAVHKKINWLSLIQTLVIWITLGTRWWVITH
jgi:hypothetical protein